MTSSGSVCSDKQLQRMQAVNGRERMGEARMVCFAAAAACAVTSSGSVCSDQQLQRMQ
jgi:hypothetical protein